MMIGKSYAWALATVGLASAESRVVSLFIPDADPQPLAASIAGEGSGTTTYSINCPPGTDGSDCGMGAGLWLTAGPTTTEYMLSDYEQQVPDSIVCSFGGTTTAICTEVLASVGGSKPYTTEKVTFAQSEIEYLPVTITAGSGSVSSVSTTTSSPDATGTSDTSSEATKSSSSQNTESSVPTTSSAAGASQTSSAGVPRITGNAYFAFGGAAVVLAAGTW